MSFDMFNFNLDLKHADEVLKSPIVIILFILVISSLTMIFGMSLASDDPAIICAEQIKLIEVQKNQITQLETKHAECVASGETSCIEREQRICRQEKESIKQNCNDLIDRILKGKPK
tara:strand:+ start:2764 stop:3114 length:351 start_codon:yes stop_codon:yes gene_type:complete